MSTPLHLVSDPSFLLASNVNNANTSAYQKIPPSFIKKTILCAANRRNRFGVAKSGKIMLESAYIIASRLRIIPEPLELLLREFGAGNGGRNGFSNGFGWGGFDGWKRRRRRINLGIVGILVICGVVGLWLVMGKGLVLDGDTLLGGLGLGLLGFSVEGWRRGAKDWILGFCCCAFLVCLVLKKDDLQAWLKYFGSMKKGGRRRRRRAF